MGLWDFESLYRERYSPLVRLARMLLGTAGSAEAEEVVQDAFAKLHRRWASVAAPERHVRAAVANLCHNRARHAAVARRRAPALLDRAPSAPGPDHMVDAIALLPHRQRAVIVLRYYEDMSEAEIAGALGCRPGTVKSLASRGLAELRRVVER